MRLFVVLLCVATVAAYVSLAEECEGHRQMLNNSRQFIDLGKAKQSMLMEAKIINMERWIINGLLSEALDTLSHQLDTSATLGALFQSQQKVDDYEAMLIDLDWRMASTRLNVAALQIEYDLYALSAPHQVSCP